MISSTVSAPKYGKGRAGGKLIVDGLDETVFRKATFAFKPFNDAQRGQLIKLLDASRETYNGALQSKRDAWRHPSKSKVALFDHFTALTELHEERGDLFVGGLQPLRWALRRVDEAFGAFYRRVKAGETPGYPRFKSWQRWSTFGYDEPSGWSLNLDSPAKDGVEAEKKADTKPVRRRRSKKPTKAELARNRKHQKAKPHLFIQGVGVIPLGKPAVRQLLRYIARGGVATTLTITRANREGTAWRAAIGFKNLAREKVGTPMPGSVAGIDRGVAVLAAAASSDSYAGDTGQLLHHSVAVEAGLAKIRAQIEELQRKRSAKKKYSRNWRRLSKKVALLHRKAANITENWARHIAGDLVRNNEVLVWEDLNLAGMTKSAKGTIEEPGKNVAAKSGLNRSLAEASPGKITKWAGVKAESAGRRTWLVNPAYTSQQCSSCKVIETGNRISRDVFYCSACGHYEHADINAARNIRARGLAAETAWRAEGSPPLVRPKPRLRRRKAAVEPEPSAAQAA